MRYRREDDNNDYVFGMGDISAHINTPEAVACAVKSRLELATNQWFLDLREGTPYREHILGKYKFAVYNQAIYDRIKETKGVIKIIDYHSEYSPDSRHVNITVTIDTIYGTAEVQANI